MSELCLLVPGLVFISLAVLSHLYLSLSLPNKSSTLLHSPEVASFTADSILSQLLNARTSLALGPTAKYQEAYYVYEELKGMQGGRTESSLAGIAVAQSLLGRWDEAGQAADEAAEMVSDEIHSTVTSSDSIFLPRVEPCTRNILGKLCRFSATFKQAHRFR